MQQAIQIRQSPFSGDSCSDSSDIDEPNGVLPSLSCSRDKARLLNSCHPAARCKSPADWSLSGSSSETSSDYAFPPEDGASVKTDSSDVCLPVSAAKSAAAGSLDSYKKVDIFLVLSISCYCGVHCRF